MVETKVTLKRININQKDIFVPNQTVDQVSKFLLTNEQTLVAITKSVFQNLLPIQQSAYNYLAKLRNSFRLLQKTAQDAEIVQQSRQLVQQGIMGSALQLAKQCNNYLKTLDQVQNFLHIVAIETDVFSQKLLKILNIDKELIYIPDYENPILYKTDLKNLLSNGQYSALKLRKTKEEMQNLVKTGDAIKVDIRNGYLSNAQAKKLQTVYAEVYKRYMDHLSSTHRVMWNLGSGIGKSSRWNVMKILNRGDLVETYANIVFSRKYTLPKGYSKNNLPETGIQVFMQAMNQVDTVVDLLESDIMLSNNNKTIAIKGFDSSVPGITDALKLALDLITFIGDEQSIKSFIEKRQQELAYNKKGERKGLRNFIQASAKKSFIKI